MAHQPGLSRGTVAVGADGVRITGLFLQRFVPWDAIEGVGNARDKLMVVIRLRDGGTLRFRVSPADCTAWGVGREILRRRDEALERNPASPLRALRDANADLGRWVARVRDVALGGYRQEVATPDVLIRVAEDPSAAPEQRVGAALALAKAPEAIRARVHVAAKSTARPLLAEAMVEAVEGEVDVDRLKRVLG